MVIVLVKTPSYLLTVDIVFQAAILTSSSFLAPSGSALVMVAAVACSCVRSSSVPARGPVPWSRGVHGGAVDRALAG